MSLRTIFAIILPLGAVHGVQLHAGTDGSAEGGVAVPSNMCLVKVSNMASGEVILEVGVPKTFLGVSDLSFHVRKLKDMILRREPLQEYKNDVKLMRDAEVLEEDTPVLEVCPTGSLELSAIVSESHIVDLCLAGTEPPAGLPLEHKIGEKWVPASLEACDRFHVRISHRNGLTELYDLRPKENDVARDELHDETAAREQLRWPQTQIDGEPPCDMM